MATEKMALQEALGHWAGFAREYRLPAWESIPNFGLYMDQVVVLLQQYLNFLPGGEGKESFVTASAINNYVRLKLMPAPEKKKYGRVHIAYLLMILTLKLSLSISQIRQLLPMGLEEAEVQSLYGDFCAQVADVCGQFSRTLDEAAQNAAPDAARRLVRECALHGACQSLLAGLLLGLDEAEA